MNRTVRGTAIAWLLAMMAGCAAGPDFRRPAAPDTQAYVAGALPEQTASAPGAAGAAQRLVPGAQVPAQWWTAFGSPALDALVAAALEANPDLQAARAALRAARETAAAQRGAFWPTVDASAGSARQKELDAAPYTLHTARLGIGYVPDVFGGQRRQAEGLAAQAEGQRFEAEAVRTTLVANVVATAIEEASLRAQIAATQELVALSTRLLDITRRQYRAGDAGGADVAAQEAALAEAEAALPPLQKQLAAQRNRLAALCGRLPSAPPEQRFALDELSLPRDVPLGVPAQLVERRPDIRAAEAQLHAASAQIGVAVAARLPGLTLTASLGSSTARASGLFRGGGIWAAGADLLQPVFAGGALRHQQRAAQAAYDKAAAQYRSTVLSAFQDTADTLQAIVSDAETLRAASAAEAVARKRLDMARRQHELGAAAQAELILAQQGWQEAVLVLVQARAGRYADTVALYQALGGWWPPPGSGDAAAAEG